MSKINREDYYNQNREAIEDTIIERMYEDGTIGGGDADPYEYLNHDVVDEELDECYELYLDEYDRLEDLRERNK